MDVDRALGEHQAVAAIAALLAQDGGGEGAELGGVGAAAALAAEVLPHEEEEAPQVGRHQQLRVAVVDDFAALDRLPRVQGQVERGAGESFK